MDSRSNSFQVLIKLEAVRELRVLAEQYASNDDRAEELKAKKAEKAVNNKILDTVAQVKTHSHGDTEH